MGKKKQRAGRRIQERRRLKDYYRSMEAQQNCENGPPLLPQYFVYRNNHIPGEKNRYRDFYKRKPVSEDKILPQHLVYRNNLVSKNLVPATGHSSQNCASGDRVPSQNFGTGAKRVQRDSVPGDDLILQNSTSEGKFLSENSEKRDELQLQNTTAGSKRLRESSVSEAEVLSQSFVPEAKRLRHDPVSRDKLVQNRALPSLNSMSQVRSTDSPECKHMPKEDTMTSFGRGRGWACNSNGANVVRKIGKPINQHSTEVNNLLNAIDALALNSSVPQAKVKEIVTLFQSALVKESLSSIADQLFKIALEDRLFGVKLAIPCSDSEFMLLKDDQSENPLRHYLLCLMQTEYEKRAKTRETSAKLFQNAVSFLGEVFYRLRISSTHLHCLGKPLLTCLSMLLETATLEDIEIVATQVMINGIIFHERKVPELPTFMNEVREVLMSRNVCAASRGLLLLTLEVANREFAPLPEELQEFYATQLGSRTLTNMQRYSIQDSSNANNNHAEMFTLRRAHADKQISNVPPKVPDEVRSRVQNPTTNAVPRAIRGSGAGEAGKDQEEGLKSDPFPTVDMHHRRRPVKFANPKHEHDDRFEKDYD